MVKKKDKKNAKNVFATDVWRQEALLNAEALRKQGELIDELRARILDFEHCLKEIDLCPVSSECDDCERMIEGSLSGRNIEDYLQIVRWHRGVEA